MLRTTKNMRDKYEKIQNYLFDLIPEKWEEIYLYASVFENADDEQTGEMYFYYFPKSLLKKKPVNVYEVPKKFNINETEYLKIVDNLYQIIQDLKQDFKDTEQRLWTNLTISIVNSKFKIEFFYDKISSEEYASYIRHIVWRYQYLHLGGEIKEERKILEKYLDDISYTTKEKEKYEAGMYVKAINNIIGFDKEIEVAQEKQKEQEQKSIEQEERKNKKLQEKAKKEEEKRRKEEEKNKNQILKV